MIVWSDGFFSLTHNVTEAEHSLRVTAARGHINDGFSPYPTVSDEAAQEAQCLEDAYGSAGQG